jgi:hypothetical protein
MSENQTHNDMSLAGAGDQDIKTMITRVQQQLDRLEKKVDILMTKLDAKAGTQQSPYRPTSFEERRSTGGSARPFHERSSFAGRPFERHRDGEQPRSFGHGRTQEQSRGQGFKKPFSGKRSGFGPQKPFHSKRAGSFHK